MKKIYTLCLWALITAPSYAQQIFGDAAQKAESEAKSIFPYVAAVIFIAGALGLYGTKLAGKEKDVKGFFVGLGVLALAMVAISGAFIFVTGVRL